MDYPIADVIRRKAAALNNGEGMPISQLVATMGKTREWFYKMKSIDQMTLENIVKLSKVLEFDLLHDYDQWLINNKMPSISQWHEPESSYQKTEKISVSLSLRGDPHAIGLNFVTVLNLLKKECDNYGIEVV